MSSIVSALRDFRTGFVEEFNSIEMVKESGWKGTGDTVFRVAAFVATVVFPLLLASTLASPLLLIVGGSVLTADAMFNDGQGFKTTKAAYTVLLSSPFDASSTNMGFAFSAKVDSWKNWARSFF